MTADEIRTAIGLTATEQGNIFLGAVFTNSTRRLQLQREGGGNLNLTIPDERVRHSILDGTTLNFYYLETSDSNYDVNMPDYSIDIGGIVPEDDTYYLGQVASSGNFLGIINVPNFPSTYHIGMRVIIQTPDNFENTGSVTLRINGDVVQSLFRSDGALLESGELTGSRYLRLVHSTGGWVATNLHPSPVSRASVYTHVKEILEEDDHIELNEDDTATHNRDHCGCLRAVGGT